MSADGLLFLCPGRDGVLLKCTLLRETGRASGLLGQWEGRTWLPPSPQEKVTTHSPTPSHSLLRAPASSLGAHPAQHPRQASRQVDTHMGRGHWRGERPFMSWRLAVAGGSPVGGAGLRDTPLFIWEKSPTKEEREEPCTTGQAKWTLGLSWQLVASPLIPLPSARSVHTMGVVTFYLPEDQVGSCWGFWGLRPLILDYVRESRQGIG